MSGTCNTCILTFCISQLGCIKLYHPIWHLLIFTLYHAPFWLLINLQKLKIYDWRSYNSSWFPARPNNGDNQKFSKYARCKYYFKYACICTYKKLITKRKMSWLAGQVSILKKLSKFYNLTFYHLSQFRASVFYNIILWNTNMIHQKCLI